MTSTHTRTYTATEPQIGDRVHFVQRGSADGRYAPACATALVVAVGTGRDGFASKESLAVNVVVNAPQGGTFPHLGTAFSLPGGLLVERVPGTWHWKHECPADQPNRLVEVELPDQD